MSVATPRTCFSLLETTKSESNAFSRTFGEEEKRGQRPVGLHVGRKAEAMWFDVRCGRFHSRTFGMIDVVENCQSEATTYMFLSNM
jgi:hypothetical protein